VISAIVYGRNDNYSYALDRRTALGLNQLALQLEQGRDEIIFVDYNTDNDLPTHPEALADTLTSTAVELVRVIRVRPEVHASLTRPGPPVREAVCRNIALRRVKSTSEWVLSTNPDCLLISRTDEKLGDLVKSLPEGYFGLPRFELPRLMWEQLPRTDPIAAANQALSFAQNFALNEVVSHYLPEIGYDAPGDFQLAKTSVLSEICGFDEDMSWGWHVDSNMNARLGLLYGHLMNFNEASGGDLGLYHTEHSRRISPKHASGRAEDSEEEFVKQVEQTVPRGQAENWGFPDETFEEFLLSKPPAKRIIYDTTRTSKRSEPVSFIYGPETFGLLPEAPEDHVVAFLIDQFAFMAPGSKVACVGEIDAANRRLLDRLRMAQLPVTLLEGGDLEAVVRDANAVCLFAPNPLAETRAPDYEKAFCEIISQESKNLGEGLPARRIVSVNTPHSQFEAPFLEFFDCAMTPVASRVRFGEIKKNLLGRKVLTDLFEEGPAGNLVSGRLTTQLGEEGYFAMVRTWLAPGAWRLDYEMDLGLSTRGTLVPYTAFAGSRQHNWHNNTLMLCTQYVSVQFTRRLDAISWRTS